MYQYLEDTLCAFRCCFSRKAAFHWFVILILAFLVREDHPGITYAVRDLFLCPASYEKILHFFYSSSWKLSSLREKWYQIVKESGKAYMVKDQYVLVGDGVKQSKEAYQMPGVKKLHQESEDSSKGEYIYGHLFGAVGMVIGNEISNYCVPLFMNLQDGLKAAANWKDSGISSESHVIQMIDSGYSNAKKIGKSIFVLDRYFLTVPALTKLDALNTSDDSGHILEIVTKAKANCTAFEEPPKREEGTKGRPRKRGESVKLSQLFKDMKAFTVATVCMYGENRTVYYLCKDLLWGKKLYKKLRFVMVDYKGMQSILVSTDLGLSAEEIIELYARRFSIECTFRSMKQLLGGFSYHFWTSFLDRFNHFKKKEEPDVLSYVNDEEIQKHILLKIRAIEGYVHLTCIAMGIIQICALSQEADSDVVKSRYLRTVSSRKISEATIMHYFRKSIFVFTKNQPDWTISQIITQAQSDDFASL